MGRAAWADESAMTSMVGYGHGTGTGTDSCQCHKIQLVLTPLNNVLTFITVLLQAVPTSHHNSIGQ